MYRGRIRYLERRYDEIGCSMLILLFLLIFRAILNFCGFIAGLTLTIDFVLRKGNYPWDLIIGLSATIIVCIFSFLDIYSFFKLRKKEFFGKIIPIVQSVIWIIILTLFIISDKDLIKLLWLIGFNAVIILLCLQVKIKREIYTVPLAIPIYESNPEIPQFVGEIEENTEDENQE